MLVNYLDEYYKGKIKTGELANKIGIHPTEMANHFKHKGLLTYTLHFQRLNFDNEKLKTTLVVKYNSLKSRCNGINNDKYNHIYEGMEYLNVIDWVDFCNSNKKLLEKMWEQYVNNNKSIKYCISIDRINGDKGYILDNIQFITNGFNAWKPNINRPIRVKHKNSDEWFYFMSCTEGSKYFNLREKVFGEILRKDGSYNKEYTIEISTTETVLEKSNCKNIEEYYNRFIQ